MARSRSGSTGVAVAGHVLSTEHDVAVDAEGVELILVDEAVHLAGRDGQVAGGLLYGQPLRIGIFHSSRRYTGGRQK